MADQISFSQLEFADNPEPRCACVLLLDTSKSMAGEPIEELNAALAEYKDDLTSDDKASKRVEVSVVTFGPVRVVCEFQTAEQFVPPVLAADGRNTPMGAAVSKAIERVEHRKQIYKGNGVPYYRPWIILITDGAATDLSSRAWFEAVAQVRQGEAEKKFVFFAVGLQDADFKNLLQFTLRPMKLKGLQFRDLFCWLSGSQRRVSHSSPGAPVQIVQPASVEIYAPA